jgi:hypothetical protein
VTSRKAQGFVRDARGPVLDSCFAWCRGARCTGAVNEAELPDAFIAPPPPSFALRLALGLVHHPRAAAGALVAIAAAFGAIAIATRPRPKRRKKIG